MIADHYKVLGVGKGASAQEIKKRYRHLAKQHHPDANQGSKKSEELFKRINTAYEVLRDKKKRAEYDRKRGQRRHEDAEPPRRGGAGRQYGRRSPFEENIWSNFAHSRTEQRPREDFIPQEEKPLDPNAPTRGFDLQFMLETPFATAALGGSVPYSYERYVNCAACAGTGQDGACPTCLGKRQIAATASINVEITPGVADQVVRRLERLGGEGRNGGPPGDLFLRICIAPDPRWKRAGSDIYTEVRIPARLADRGGEVAVDTLESTRIIPVEPGTLTGEELRLRGLGAAVLGTKKRGDFVVKFLVMET